MGLHTVDPTYIWKWCYDMYYSKNYGWMNKEVGNRKILLYMYIVCACWKFGRWIWVRYNSSNTVLWDLGGFEGIRAWIIQSRVRAISSEEAGNPVGGSVGSLASLSSSVVSFGLLLVAVLFALLLFLVFLFALVRILLVRIVSLKLKMAV